MDVDNLLAGQRFDKKLSEALDSCDVLIAVMGRRWMDLLKARTTQSGEIDYVREEIAAALRRGIVVIPVRVGLEGRLPALPSRDDLPENLRDLILHQKQDVVHERFGRDMDDLKVAIEAALVRAHAEPAPNYAPQAAEYQLPFGNPGQALAPGYAPQQGYAESDADFDEMLAEEDEQPRGGRRVLMIAASLAGAIGLSGAMAYSYKVFIDPSGGRAAVIKATDSGPNKVKPAVAGGKGVAHTDKKLLNRLGEDGTGPVRIGTPSPNAADAQDDRASDDPNSPRKVKIIPITPGGPPAATASAPPRPADTPQVAVPGVTLENTGPMQAPPSAARVQLPPAEPAAPAKTPVPKAKTAPAAPVVATSATSGYVAVVASKTSRMEALKAFAELQQKYGDVLASKTPDLQEANLGDKGVRYRAVVGPPGSRDAASGVCKQLKTAGYDYCWVTAY
jgi:hypothetical protein